MRRGQQCWGGRRGELTAARAVESWLLSSTDRPAGRPCGLTIRPWHALQADLTVVSPSFHDYTTSSTPHAAKFSGRKHEQHEGRLAARLTSILLSFHDCTSLCSAFSPLALVASTSAPPAWWQDSRQQGPKRDSGEVGRGRMRRLCRHKVLLADVQRHADNHAQETTAIRQEVASRS